MPCSFKTDGDSPAVGNDPHVAAAMHDDELTIDPSLVRSLVQASLPELGDLAVLGLDDATWAKSMGWALLIALITFPYYWQAMPSRCADRRAMAAAVLAEA